MSDALKAEYLEALEARLNWTRYNKFHTYFPEEGAFRRELYPKHIAAIEASKDYPVTAVIGGAGTGKSDLGAFICVAHATGLYPKWWNGHRFDRAITANLASKTWLDTKMSIQTKLLGPENDEGSGMIPANLIVGKGPKIGSSGCHEYIEVMHVSGRTSLLYIKSYEQGPDSFRSTNRDFIQFDEEPAPEGLAIYANSVNRFRGESSDGRMLLTFTPDQGISEVVQLFYWNLHPTMTEEQYNKSGRWMIEIAQDDVPHQSAAEIEFKYANAPEHLKDTLRYGRPMQGTGNVYQVNPDLFTVAPFQIPRSWPRVWVMDPGWEDPTAVVWGAHDRTNGIWYIYDEHYQNRWTVGQHAFEVRRRGQWIPGLIDTQANASSAMNGSASLANEYRANGLRVSGVKKGLVEDTADVVHEWLAGGKLKVFSTCTNLLREYRMYRRDEQGKIISKYDHALDALRYLVTGGGVDCAMTQPFGNGAEGRVREETFGLSFH